MAERKKIMKMMMAEHKSNTEENLIKMTVQPKRLEELLKEQLELQ